MGVIEEFMDGFLERYVPGIYEMLEACYKRGFRDGQEDIENNFQAKLDEARYDGYQEGYEDGYGDRCSDVDDAYAEAYMEGFSDAMNGCPSEIKGVLYCINGKVVDSDEINTGGEDK